MNFSKIYTLLIPLLLSASIGFSQKPNVIIVITDDQGYGDIGYYGNTVIKTPALDKFASESVNLTDFHSSTTCSPTRAGIMTGRNGNRNGVWHTIKGAGILNEDETTMADVFKGAGYSTGMFGKWHLGDNHPHIPNDRGFDEVVMHKGGSISQLPDYWLNDLFDDVYYRNNVPEQFEGYCTDVFFEEAMNFIESEQDNPFFVYLSTNAPHGPFNVPEEYYNLYAGMGLSVAQRRSLGMITNVDDNFALLMAKLEDLGIDDNTIVIFTTDNGGHPNRTNIFTAGMRGDKGDIWEGGHRVPCIIRWPDGNLDGGEERSELTSHLDLLPTLASMAGISFKSTKTMDGMDISNYILGIDDEIADRYVVVDNQRILIPEKGRNSCVMQDKWRLLDGRKLYNIASDPGQSNNIASQYPQKVAELNAYYEEWWASISQEIKFSTIDLGVEPNEVLSVHDTKTINDDINMQHSQSHVREAFRIPPAPYQVKFTKAGTYRFSLYRWPPESGLVIGATTPAVNTPIYMNNWEKGKAVDYIKAHISVAGIEQEVAVDLNAVSSDFVLDIPKGATDLTAYFESPNGNTSSAFYVMINLEEDAPLVAYANCNYQGNFFLFDNEGEFFWRDGDFDNDEISSFKVAEGYEVTFYEGKFIGDSLTFKSGEVGCLERTKLEDKISSLVLRKTVIDENLALYQPTIQSSTSHGGKASRAVDGNTNGTYTNNSVTHTNAKGGNGTSNPWWRVDLGKKYTITGINVYNRTDLRSFERLNGAEVYVGNTNSTNPNDYSKVGTLNTNFIQTINGINKKGRYVMIRLPGDGKILSLAEVQVYGIPANSKATLYQDCNYNGQRVSLGIGEYPNMQSVGLLNNDISSLQVPAGLQVTLYNRTNYRDSSITFTADDNCLMNNNFNDKTGSFIIEVAGADNRSSSKSLVLLPKFGLKTQVHWVFQQEVDKPVKQFTILYGTSEESPLQEVGTVAASEYFRTEAYQFLHHEAKEGKNYYQIMVEYEDGNVVYPMWDDIDFKVTAVPLLVAPNPASDLLNVDVSKYLGQKIKYSISTMQGVVVADGEVESDHERTLELDLDQLNNGMYVIQLQPEGYRAVAAKFMVAKDY